MSDNQTADSRRFRDARDLREATYDKACRAYYEAVLAITAAEKAADAARLECDRLEKEMGI